MAACVLAPGKGRDIVCNGILSNTKLHLFPIVTLFHFVYTLQCNKEMVQLDCAISSSKHFFLYICLLDCNKQLSTDTYRST